MPENDNGQGKGDAPEVLRLSAADALAFTQALLSPPEPSTRLVEAIRRYRQTVRR